VQTDLEIVAAEGVTILPEWPAAPFNEPIDKRREPLERYADNEKGKSEQNRKHTTDGSIRPDHPDWKPQNKDRKQEQQ